MNILLLTRLVQFIVHCSDAAILTLCEAVHTHAPGAVVSGSLVACHNQIYMVQEDTHVGQD